MKDKPSKSNGFHAFLKGFASAFDITGQAFISIPDLDTGFQRDCEALRGDWQRVGDDMRRAMNVVAREQ
jgi:hypothetical protein